MYPHNFTQGKTLYLIAIRANFLKMISDVMIQDYFKLHKQLYLTLK